jgi:beta-N-acetylhexosaminidase
MDTSSLTLKQKIGQLLFVGVPGPGLDGATSELLTDVMPGGICLFARNIRDPDQTRALLDGLRNGLRIEPLLSVDQEGGLVDRLRRVLGPLPAASRLQTAADAAAQAGIIADCLSFFGFNMNFAPVVDVIDAERSVFTNGLHSRAYGIKVEDVIEMSTAFLETLQAGGILGCLKHFPGLGASEVDSHEELPLVNVSVEEFESVDLRPYRDHVSKGLAHAVMVAHAAYPLLGLQEKDAGGKLLPSSLSFNFIQKLLRDEIGFKGLVLTDDLEMGAILKNYGIGEAAVLAVLAGNDMVSICADPQNVREAHRSLMTAAESGRISVENIDAAVTRVFKLKRMIKAADRAGGQTIPALSERVKELSDRLS